MEANYNGGIWHMLLGKLRLKNRHVSAVIGLVILLYLSKPDKLGVFACSKFFHLEGLEQTNIRHSPYILWKPFEASKYRFKVSPDQFDSLSLLLHKNGYSEWGRGGLQFPNFNRGHRSDEDTIYCMLSNRGYDYYWVYEQKNQCAYAFYWKH